MADDQKPEEKQPVAPTPEPETPPVDLAEEAGRAAAKEPLPKERTRSLDDLELPEELRPQLEAYVSRSITEAVKAHDQRAKAKQKEEGYLKREQVEELLAQRDAEYQRRENAKERFLTVLGEEGIHPGSEAYAKVQSTYTKAIEDERFTPAILLSDAGVRTLVAMAGLGGRAGKGGDEPREGLPRTYQGTNVAEYADGSLQLNPASGAEDTLEARSRKDMAKALGTRPQS